MTKEEAAIIIHKLKQDALTGAVRRYEPFEGEVLLSAEFYDAINMAIEALEQEPCEDAISRQAVLEIIRKCHCEEWIKADIGTPIVALSPFTPKEYKPGHWHFDATDHDFPRRWICPHCGTWQSYGEPPYCPWCGKRVLKEGEA